LILIDWCWTLIQIPGSTVQWQRDYAFMNLCRAVVKSPPTRSAADRPTKRLMSGGKLFGDGHRVCGSGISRSGGARCPGDELAGRLHPDRDDLEVAASER
jgi:hypothetical protein